MKEKTKRIILGISTIILIGIMIIFLDIGEVTRLIESPKRTDLLGLRDRAVLEALYSTGIRVSELVNLNFGQIDFDNQLIKVTGKGNKQRIIPFGETARKTLEQFTRFMGFTKLTPKKQSIFVNGKKQRISIRTVQRHVKQYLLLLFLFSF